MNYYPSYFNQKLASGMTFTGGRLEAYLILLIKLATCTPSILYLLLSQYMLPVPHIKSAHHIIITKYHFHYTKVENEAQIREVLGHTPQSDSKILELPTESSAEG